MNIRTSVLAAGLFACVIFALGNFAAAEDEGPFVECEHQRYALCATSSCFVYNQVAYCACDKERGTSISAALDSPEGDICELNQQGRWGGYMMSTFSVPESVLPPDGTQALYTCPPGSTGAYAQCDGGICFRSTSSRKFPGFDDRLRGQIICACPITFAHPVIGHSYQIAGDYVDGECNPDVFDTCNEKFPGNIIPQGTIIPVGAPPGTARILGEILEGHPVPVNECFEE